MPTIITRGAASVQAFGLMSSGGTYGWMAQLTASSSFAVATYALRVTSTGSYVIGTSFGGASYGSEYVVTINSTGTAISSNTTFQNSGSNLYNNVYDITLDSSDNIYSVGRRYEATPSCCCTFNFAYWDSVTKTDSASSNLGSTYFGGGGASAGFFTNISKFSDGTILISGYTTSQLPVIVKLNSALTTVSWGLQNNDITTERIQTEVDSSNNVIGLRVNNNQLNIIKTNSSGTITFKQYLNGFGTYFWATSTRPGFVSKPTLDASSNIYFTGQYYYQEIIGCCVIYLPRSMALSVDSTAATLRFAKGYVGSTTIQTPTAMVKDSSDNMYFANYYNGTSGQGVIIFKINSSGVLQWARAIIQSQVSLFVVQAGATPLAIDGTNFVLAMGSGTVRKAYVLKMPTDGSGSGSNFSMNSKTFSYVTPTDFSVIDLTGLTLVTDTGTSYTSNTPTLTTTGIAPAVSTAYTIQNKKI
jgi:hypothetical protein